MSSPDERPKAEPNDVLAADLAALLAEGTPASPIEDFELYMEGLGHALQRAREIRDARENEQFQQAEQLVEDLETKVAEADEQLRRLEMLRAEFSGLGDAGATGLTETVGALERLHDHRSALESRLSHPALQQATARRHERIRRFKAELLRRLHPEAASESVDAVITEILGVIRGPDIAWAESAIDSFADKLTPETRSAHSASIVRFWKQLARRLESTDPVAATQARERALRIEREIQDRERRDSTAREATSLIDDITTGLRGLSHLGHEEIKAQLAIWLGRLRKLQDEEDLDDPLLQSVNVTFGRINTTRKDLRIDFYFDALNRNFTTNWDTYLRGWEGRLLEARAHDRRVEAREQELADDQRRREEREEASRRLQEERVKAITSLLIEASDPASWTSDQGVQEELRELILTGVESGGVHSAGFLQAVVPLAPLIVQGYEYRSLRRALDRAGHSLKEVVSIPKAAESRLPEPVVSRVKAKWAGRTIAIVGGMPKEETRRAIEGTLALREARWYELYRGHDTGEAAVSAIRAGGVDAVVLLIRFAGHEINRIKAVCDVSGVPCHTAPSGGGLSAVTRALDAG